MSRRYIARDTARPFSDAVLIDEKTLYLSGRLGLVPGTDRVPASASEEAHLVMKEFVEILGLAGMTMDHLVSVQVFCPDVTLWGAFNEVYRQYFTGPLPARAFLGSGPLLFGARFEMQGIAVKDEA